MRINVITTQCLIELSKKERICCEIYSFEDEKKPIAYLSWKYSALFKDWKQFPGGYVF